MVTIFILAFFVCFLEYDISSFYNEFVSLCIIVNTLASGFVMKQFFCPSMTELITSTYYIHTVILINYISSIHPVTLLNYISFIYALLINTLLYISLYNRLYASSFLSSIIYLFETLLNFALCIISFYVTSSYSYSSIF